MPLEARDGVRGRRAGGWLVVAVVAGAVAVTYSRLFYGVDFTDESFYVAVPYRLVRGARPFVDETDVQELTAAILVYPFVRAYDAVAGVDGIVLFLRQLQFLFSLGVAAAVFASVRLLVGARRALLIAAMAVLFVPFDIHSLSYDTLGSGLFTAGCLLSFRSLTGSRRWSLAGGASCLGLAAFAYPPLLLAVAVVGVAGVLLVPSECRRRHCAAAALALGAPLGALAVLVGLAGFHTVIADYQHFSQSFGQGGGVGKLAAIAGHEWRQVPLRYPLLAALALLALCWRRGRFPVVLPASVLPLLLLPPRPTSYAASLEYVASLGWLALPLLTLVHRRPDARRLFACVWVPALLAGVTTAYSSTNGGTNFALGSLPAAIVCAVYLVWICEGPPGTGRALPSAAPLPLLAVAAVLALSEVVPVYRDGPISTLTTMVRHGPYAGLLTSASKRDFLFHLDERLAGLGAACRVAFLNDFPAGYLLTAARPDANSAWIASVRRPRIERYQNVLLDYYRRVGYPDVIVLMQRIPYGRGAARGEHYRASEPIIQTLHRSYRVGVRERDYRIYIRRHSGCGARRR
jgi:hypothetical protein